METGAVKCTSAYGLLGYNLRLHKSIHDVTNFATFFSRTASCKGGMKALLNQAFVSSQILKNLEIHE